MAQRCTTCTHPQKSEIDRAALAGASYRDIARNFGASHSAVHRHSRHIQKGVAAVSEQDPVAYGRAVLAQARALGDRAIAILDRAEEEGDWRAATGAIREARSCLEFLARLRGEVVDRHAHLHSQVVSEPAPPIDLTKMPTELLEDMQRVAEWLEKTNDPVDLHACESETPSGPHSDPRN